MGAEAPTSQRLQERGQSFGAFGAFKLVDFDE